MPDKYLLKKYDPCLVATVLEQMLFLELDSHYTDNKNITYFYTNT
jgi:hypothetical protein